MHPAKRMFLLLLVFAFIAHGYLVSGISAEILDICEDQSGNLFVVTLYSLGIGEKYYIQLKKIAPSGKTVWASVVRANPDPGRLFADYRATMPTMTVGDDGSIYMISYLDLRSATRLYKWDPEGHPAWTRDMPSVRGLALVSGEDRICVAGQSDQEGMPPTFISFDPIGNAASIQNPAFNHAGAHFSGVDGNHILIRNLKSSRMLWGIRRGRWFVPPRLFQAPFWDQATGDCFPGKKKRLRQSPAMVPPAPSNGAHPFPMLTQSKRCLWTVKGMHISLYGQASTGRPVWRN